MTEGYDLGKSVVSIPWQMCREDACSHPSSCASMSRLTSGSDHSAKFESDNCASVTRSTSSGTLSSDLVAPIEQLEFPGSDEVGPDVPVAAAGAVDVDGCGARRSCLTPATFRGRNRGPDIQREIVAATAL